MWVIFLVYRIVVLEIYMDYLHISITAKPILIKLLLFPKSDNIWDSKIIIKIGPDGPDACMDKQT